VGSRECFRDRLGDFGGRIMAGCSGD